MTKRDALSLFTYFHVYYGTPSPTDDLLAKYEHWTPELIADEIWTAMGLGPDQQLEQIAIGKFH